MTTELAETAKPQIISSLEIGTSKVVAVISEVLPDGVVNVLGRGISLSKGVSHGGIVEFEPAVRAVNEAIQQAENFAALDTFNLTMSITGQHIESFTRIIHEDLQSGIVTQEDLDNIHLKAERISLPDDREILHIIHQEYWFDNTLPTKNPLGQYGMRLYARVYFITCSKHWLKNLQNVLEACQKELIKPVFSGLASNYSVLTEDERDSGVCLIDFGGGTIDVLLYTDGILRYSRSYPFAGTNISEYIAKEFRTTFSSAENIKIQYGSAITPPSFNGDKRIEVMGFGNHPPRALNKLQLSQLTARCYQEILSMIHQDITVVLQDLNRNYIKSELIAGFVLTGGGSQIEDIVECAKSVFGSQVRVGSPLNITGLTDYVNKPQYSTVLGLLQYTYYTKALKAEPIVKNPKVREFFKSMKKKAKQFVAGF